jgi:hypothetical protein
MAQGNQLMKAQKKFNIAVTQIMSSIGVLSNALNAMSEAVRDIAEQQFASDHLPGQTEVAAHAKPFDYRVSAAQAKTVDLQLDQFGDQNINNAELVETSAKEVPEGRARPIENDASLRAIRGWCVITNGVRMMGEIKDTFEDAEEYANYCMSRELAGNTYAVASIGFCDVRPGMPTPVEVEQAEKILLSEPQKSVRSQIAAVLMAFAKTRGLW